MSEPASPREVFTRLHERVRDDYDMDGQADLYAADGILEMPFVPDGMPQRIQGREAIRQILLAAGERARQSGRKILRYDPLVIHQTNDPEVLVAEFELHGVVAATGATYHMPFIQVLRVRNGEIVSMRDYFCAAVIATAFGANQNQGDDPER